MLLTFAAFWPFVRESCSADGRRSRRRNGACYDARMSWIRAIFVTAALAISSPAFASSAAVVVSGSKATGADKLDKELRIQLVTGGVRIVTDKALAKAAKKVGEDPSSPKVAEEAGADFLVTVNVKKVKKKYIAVGKLIDVSQGKVI